MPKTNRNDKQRRKTRRRRAVARRRPIQTSAYDEAYSQLLREVFAKRFRAHPLFRDVVLYETEHAGPVRSVPELPSADVPMQIHSFVSSATIVGLTNLDFDEHARYVNAIVDRALERAEAQMFQTLGALCKAVGNVFSQGSGEFAFETVKHAAMSVEWSLDENGELERKTLAIPPELGDKARKIISQLENDPELIEFAKNKRRELLEKRKNRRLIRPC